MIYSGSIMLKTTKKTISIDITSRVNSIVQQSGIKEGIVLVFTGHTTAGIYLGNTDKLLPLDIDNFLEGIAPNKPSYLHNQHGGGNASAHIKHLLVGASVALPLTEGKIELGQWQGIFFYELDGPRKRTISVKIIGEKEASGSY